MDAKEQRVEVERPVAGDDHFPVDDGSLRQGGAKRFGEFGEVPVERLQVA